MGIPSFSDLTTIPVQDDVLNQGGSPRASHPWIEGRRLVCRRRLPRDGVRRGTAQVERSDRTRRAYRCAVRGLRFWIHGGPRRDRCNGMGHRCSRSSVTGVIQIAATYTQRSITLTNSSSTPLWSAAVRRHYLAVPVGKSLRLESDADDTGKLVDSSGLPFLLRDEYRRGNLVQRSDGLRDHVRYLELSRGSRNESGDNIQCGFSIG